MQTLIIGGFVAAPAENVFPMTHAAGGEVDNCTDRIPRALGSADQFETDPVMLVGIHILQ